MTGVPFFLSKKSSDNLPLMTAKTQNIDLKALLEC